MDVLAERSQAGRPYRAYATIVGVYAGGLAGIWAAVRLATTQVLAPCFGRMLTWTLVWRSTTSCGRVSPR